jgi:predicted house-cleaning noncanonical NTP pyrophosphatase (MazG superfamily)
MDKQYHKLVRDGIPEIIRRKGEHCEVAVMTEEAYRQALREKLVEEAKEVSQAATLQELIMELADVQQVLDTLRTTYALSQETIVQEQAHRRAERGGFLQRLRLLRTKMNERCRARLQILQGSVERYICFHGIVHLAEFAILTHLRLRRLLSLSALRRLFFSTLALASEP